MPEQEAEPTPEANTPAPQSDQTDAPDAQETIAKLEAKLSQQGQEVAAMKSQLDLLAPFVQFGQQPAANEPAYDPEDPEQVLDHKLQTAVNGINTRVNGQVKTLEFLQQNPDLVQHKDMVAYFLERKTNPARTIDQRLKDAAQMVRDHLKDAGDKALAAQQAKQKAAAETASATTGHGGQPEASSGPEDRMQSDEDYAAERETRERELLGGIV